MDRLVILIDLLISGIIQLKSHKLFGQTWSTTKICQVFRGSNNIVSIRSNLLMYADIAMLQVKGVWAAGSAAVAKDGIALHSMPGAARIHECSK